MPKKIEIYHVSKRNYSQTQKMTSELFTEVTTLIKETTALASEKRKKAIDDLLASLYNCGRGKAILQAACVVAWKTTTPEDREKFHSCESFVKIGMCEHYEKPHWQEGCCENCGYFTCSSYCAEDTEYWCNPARDMYTCEKCGEYTCDMEKKQHSKSCGK